MAKTQERRNRPALSLHVPEPDARPGDAVDFAAIDVPAAGAAPRPESPSRPPRRTRSATRWSACSTTTARRSARGTRSSTPTRCARCCATWLMVRAFDERMYRAQRQGKTSFYMKCTGEEAIAVAAAHALDRDDMCFPTYRQQGLLIARGYPLVDMMNQIYSNKGDQLKGRQLPIMYSDQGARLLLDLGQPRHPISAGGRLGDGERDQGRQPDRRGLDRRGRDRRGRLPLRADLRRRLPRAGDPQRRQQPVGDLELLAASPAASATTFAARAVGYGIAGLRVDGNDALAVYAATRWAAERARANHGPTLIELFTYRAEGHSTSDDPTAYRPQDEADAWPLGDPIERLKEHLIALGEWDEERHAALETELAEEVRAAQKEAEKQRHPRPRPASTMSNDVRGRLRGDALAPRRAARRRAEGARRAARDADGRAMNMIQAINTPIDVMMARDPDVVVFGEDVGYFGGVFRATEGLQEKYGKTRVFDTPITEGGIIGVAVGMGAYGLQPVLEIQFADYIYPGFDQIVREAARLRYRSAGEFTAPITIRSPFGGGIFGGQTHSQSPEALFTHVAGLKTVIPSNPYDAKGLLIAAIEDNDPVIFFEPKRIYNGPFDGHYDRPVKPWAKHPRGEVPEGHYTVPLGKAAVVREGEALTVLAYGTMVHVALAAVEESGVDAEVIDLRTLVPLDIETIEASVKKTGRCLIVHEATAHLAASAPSCRRWCRSAASTISRRRSSASPAGTRPIRTASNGPISPARCASARRSRHVMED